VVSLFSESKKLLEAPEVLNGGHSFWANDWYDAIAPLGQQQIDRTLLAGALSMMEREHPLSMAPDSL
jgi:hypothetical protein